MKDFKNLVAGENANFIFFIKEAITEFRVYVKKSRKLFGNDTFRDEVRAFKEERKFSHTK